MRIEMTCKVCGQVLIVNKSELRLTYREHLRSHPEANAEINAASKQLSELRRQIRIVIKEISAKYGYVPNN